MSGTERRSTGEVIAGMLKRSWTIFRFPLKPWVAWVVTACCLRTLPHQQGTVRFVQIWTKHKLQQKKCGLTQ